MNFDCTINLALLIAVFVLGFTAGAVIKSPRLARLERKVTELEIRAGLRKAE